MEMTFAMIKPNGVKSGLIGRILDRYTSARLSVVGLKLHQMTSEEARGFYAEHVNKPLLPQRAAPMPRGPAVTIALAGENAIAAVRAINGATNPAKAEPGTLRYDFAPSMTENVVHSSDSPASAEREVAFWFKKENLYEYEAASNKACTVLG